MNVQLLVTRPERQNPSKLPNRDELKISFKTPGIPGTQTNGAASAGGAAGQLAALPAVCLAVQKI